MWKTIQGISTSARKRAVQYMNDITPFKAMKTSSVKYGQPVSRSRGFDQSVEATRTAFKPKSEGGMGWDKATKHWWAGGNLNTLEAQAKKTTGAKAGRRRFARRATVGVLGGTLASSTLLGSDSLPTQIGSGAISAGAVGAGTFGAMELGMKVGAPKTGIAAAAGIAGYSVLNMIQRGNQTGPF